MSCPRMQPDTRRHRRVAERGCDQTGDGAWNIGTLLSPRYPIYLRLNDLVLTSSNSAVLP